MNEYYVTMTIVKEVMYKIAAENVEEAKKKSKNYFAINIEPNKEKETKITETYVEKKQ